LDNTFVCSGNAESFQESKVYTVHLNWEHCESGFSAIIVSVIDTLGYICFNAFTISTQRNFFDSKFSIYEVNARGREHYIKYQNKLRVLKCKTIKGFELNFFCHLLYFSSAIRKCDEQINLINL